MSGWLLILALLLLGGVLSTLGDRLGSKVGKARLSLMGMRPRRTAVLITVLTGSLISGISLGLMLLVSDRLRTGLFELDQLERRLRDSRQALLHSREQLQRSERDRRQAEGERRQARGQLAQAEQQGLPAWVHVLLGLLALSLACIAWLLQRIKQERAALPVEASRATAAE